MSAELLYRQRLAILRSIFASKIEREGGRISWGGAADPCSEAQLAKQDEHMRSYLGCNLPACYSDVLREFNGLGTQGVVLYGTDEPTDNDAATWPRRGIIYATLSYTWHTDPDEPRTSPWLVIGESDCEIYLITRDGKRFCIFMKGKPLSHPPTEERASLDSLLCYIMDLMVGYNRPELVE